MVFSLGWKALHTKLLFFKASVSKWQTKEIERKNESYLLIFVYFFCVPLPLFFLPGVCESLSHTGIYLYWGDTSDSFQGERKRKKARSISKSHTREILSPFRLSSSFFFSSARQTCSFRMVPTGRKFMLIQENVTRGQYHYLRRNTGYSVPVFLGHNNQLYLYFCWTGLGNQYLLKVLSKANLQKWQLEGLP